MRCARKHATSAGIRKLVEASVLPLIAAMSSKIEQEHFISLVAAAARRLTWMRRARRGRQAPGTPCGRRPFTGNSPKEHRIGIVAPAKKGRHAFILFRAGTPSASGYVALGPWASNKSQTLRAELEFDSPVPRSSGSALRPRWASTARPQLLQATCSGTSSGRRPRSVSR